MKVLSLFDGISCGRVALDRAGIRVDSYTAYEIDKYAIKASTDNYPDIQRMGDVIGADFTQFYGTDLLLAGSPCQDLSNYKLGTTGRDGLAGEKSKLFFEFVRAMREVRPTWFLFENVASMSEKSRSTISEILGVDPVFINSADVCACERPRLYWTNIPRSGELPKTDVRLRDIVLSPRDVPDKYWYNDRPFRYEGDDKKVQCTMLGPGFMRNTREVYNLNAKANTLLCDGGGGNRQKKVYQDGRCRKLTPLEYERLQTLPEGYTSSLSDSRRYTAIGNGWTVDVISWLLSGLATPQAELHALIGGM